MLDKVQKTALETIEMGKQALIFLPSRASAEKTAEDIAKLTSFQLPELEQEALHALSIPTKQCRRLSHCIQKGVAFHHSGLVSKQKELIEDEFRKGTIKIICCTPTLAAGLSLPAFRVIIKSLKRFSGSWGMDWIPVLEYLQMSGRAGRPEYEAFGEAIAIAKDDTEKEEIYDRYICGVPEEIYSKLAVEPVLRTYLLSLIASGVIRNTTQVQEFFGKTFWAYQFKDMAKLEDIMERMLSLLEHWSFVVVSGKEQAGFISAKELQNRNEKALRATPLGKRVSELYLDPLTAKHFVDGIAKLEEKMRERGLSGVKPFSLLQMVSHTLELRPLLSVKRKEEELIQEEFVKRVDLLLEDEPSAFDMEYGEFMNSIKTALFFEEWIEERDEDYLLEKFDIRPGEIRVKLETADWLLYAIEELGKLLSARETVKRAGVLRIRVQQGAKEELLPLLRLKGIGRVRARRLFSNGVRDLGDVKRVDVTTLGQIIGKAIAEDIKKQVGEEVAEVVPSGRRKGQLGLGKFE